MTKLQFTCIKKRNLSTSKDEKQYHSMNMIRMSKQEIWANAYKMRESL